MPANSASVAVTLASGAASGLFAAALHLPLGLLLGSLLATGLLAALGWRPFGLTLQVPARTRNFFIPIIGVAIGGAFTPAVLAQMPGWWPSLLALCLYIPLAHFIGYHIYRRFGPLPPTTAFFGAVPGGLIESVVLGEEAGADVQMLALLQFLRLILTIIAVPLGFAWATGHSVGSGGGMSLSGPALGLRDAALLAVVGVAGYVAGHRLRLPAAVMTGPLIASAAVHLGGWVEGVPPGWAVGLTQIVVGSVLGARFAGMPKGALPMAFRLASLNVGAALVLAFAFSVVVAPLVGVSQSGVFLAFAPGGLTEMSLVALSMQISVVYVTAHHVVRIVLAVSFAKIGARWVKGHKGDRF